MKTNLSMIKFPSQQGLARLEWGKRGEGMEGRGGKKEGKEGRGGKGDA